MTFGNSQLSVRQPSKSAQNKDLVFSILIYSFQYQWGLLCLQKLTVHLQGHVENPMNLWTARAKDLFWFPV